ncbi:hypothetical protein B9479_000427 [Cryptococcus floricola]|uniref:Uncharacterized protein n=1 Tax=Cryptococcus floricola TaxID=2591691 RepID=A0A5D3B7L0_9TREE|nr:hypothetical protein B9479_000427 [Cryptococcus floricola]
MASSSPALYVLRMLWRRAPSSNFKSFSTAALARDTPDTTISASSIATPRHMSSASFLEDESLEYSAASLHLSPDINPPEPIPWPTLLPRHGVQSAKKPKICDPLFRLVGLEQYDEALAILQELQSHHQMIQRRHIYLFPALDALRAGDTAKFMLWLGLYPNKPATADLRPLREIWRPITLLMLGVKDDRALIERYLLHTAKLGLTPVTLPPLLVHLAFTLPASESLDLVSRITSAYLQYTTSSTSTSSRAFFQKSTALMHLNKIWGHYLRVLMLAGWEEEAWQLYEFPPADVRWDQRTVRVMEQQWVSKKVDVAPDLPRQIRQMLVRDYIPTPNDLAQVLAGLASPSITQTHPNLLARFQSRFLSAPSGRKRAWVFAEIINLQQEGLHDQAIEHFAKHYYWVGLPPHPLAPKGSDATPRSYPALPLLTTLFRSFFRTLPQPHFQSVPLSLSSYLDSIPVLPPSLRPNLVTYVTLIRESVYLAGPDAGMAVYERIITPNEKGEVLHEAHEELYRPIILSLAHRRQIERLRIHLDHFGSLGSLAKPTGQTYRALVAVLSKTGQHQRVAEEMVYRGLGEVGDDCFEGLIMEED